MSQFSLKILNPFFSFYKSVLAFNEITPFQDLEEDFNEGKEGLPYYVDKNSLTQNIYSQGHFKGSELIN